jgi:hypothetical protein
MRLQQLAVERVRSGLEGFMKALGSDRLTDEIEQRAMAGRSPLEPPVFDPVIFYDRPFETSPPKEAPKGAASLPLPGGFFPVLGWFGWDNRARCARVLGGAWLFENDWFGGRFAYIEGLGINDTGLIPFYDLGFDRIASSAIVI